MWGSTGDDYQEGLPEILFVGRGELNYRIGIVKDEGEGALSFSFTYDYNFCSG